MELILISGKAEAGKTTTANIIKDILNSYGKKAVIIPYGQYVKDTAKMIWDWDGFKDEDGRRLLQWWGTNYVREKDPEFWFETVHRLVVLLEDLVDYVIIDDCRFKNEIANWIYEGVDIPRWFVRTIRVERPHHKNALTPEQRNHPSETDLDNYGSWDYFLTADTYNELYVEASACAEKIYKKISS